MKCITALLFFLCISFFSAAQEKDTFHFNELESRQLVTILPDDTIYFCLSLTNKKYKVKCKGKWTPFNDIKNVDQFIKTNQAFINPNKLIIIAS